MIRDIALVLEGGGMRGAFTLGVLDHLFSEDMIFEYVIGVSAGACNAASYVSGQPGRGMKIHDQYIGDMRYINPAGLLTRRRSVFGMDFIFDEIPSQHIPYDFDAFYASGHRLVVGMTDVCTGKPTYVENPPREIFNLCCRASSAIPLFSPVVRVGDKEYLDGGTSDPIPFARALKGCKRVVVVTTREEGYEKKPLPAPHLYRAMLRKYPNMAACCAHRHEVYNAQLRALRKLEEQGTALVIRPGALRVETMTRDREILWEAYHEGEKKTGEILPALRKFVGME